MIILGLTHPISWNNAACLLIDGKLTHMVEEERLNRIKHSPHIPAKLAMEYCLSQANIKLKDVDYIAIGWDNVWDATIPNLRNQSLAFGTMVASYIALLTLFYERRLPFNINDKRVKFINHHIAHAASAYYLSGFAQANIISWDGTGGNNAGILAYGQDDKITVLKEISNENSFGRMYAEFTKLLGFRPHSDEYKVMGLAAYAKKTPVLFSFINWAAEIPTINRNLYQKYVTEVKKTIDKKDCLKDSSIALASRLQFTLENVGQRLVDYLYRKTKNRNLCLSGGVALNCAMNGKLLLNPCIENLFVQPVSHDGGVALGAAVEVYRQLNGCRPSLEFNHLYHGPSFTNAEILANLKQSGVKNYHLSDDVCRDAARLLADDKIVGWFQGAMEVGPRALGGRSILANPRNPEMKNLVNKRVKNRESWRPFAPSIIEEYAQEYLLNYKYSPFMTINFLVRPEKVREIKSAVHIDGTCRPQIVSKKHSSKYWKLINEFYKITSVPALLNTSFNVAEQPIVCTPKEAIETFNRCGLDCLAMEDYIVTK